MSFKQRIEQCGLAESRPTIRRMFLSYQTDNAIEDDEMNALYGKAKNLHDTSGAYVQIQNIPDLLVALEPVFLEIGASPLPSDAAERMFVLDCCVKYIEHEEPVLASPESSEPSTALKKALQTYGRAAMWAFQTHNNSLKPGVDLHVMPALKDIDLCRKTGLYTWREMVEALKDSYLESLLHRLEELEGLENSAGSPTEMTTEFEAAVKSSAHSAQPKKGLFGRNKKQPEKLSCKDMWESWLRTRIDRNEEYVYSSEYEEAV